MSAPKRVDIEIEQGSTFARTVMWETAPRIWKPITAITAAAPVQITATAHGVPDGWRVGVVNVQGMTQINAPHNPPRDTELLPAAVIDVNRITLDLSAADFDAYTAGGYLVYWTPHDMASYTARMTIKNRIGGTVLDVVACTVDNTAKTVSLLIDAVTAAAFTWVKGVYDLEMVSPGGVVTAILSGVVTVKREVTT
jgi:hypothetical protein